MDNVGPVSVTPAQVAHLVSRGVKTGEIIRLLVATGTWSDSGAAEISRRSRNSLTTRSRLPYGQTFSGRPARRPSAPFRRLTPGVQGPEFSGDSDALTIFATPAAPDQGRH